jgi:hypothetical protein
MLREGGKEGPILVYLSSMFYVLFLLFFIHFVLCVLLERMADLTRDKRRETIERSDVCTERMRCTVHVG